MATFTIPVEVEAFMAELRQQVSQLSERCAAMAGEKAGVQAQLQQVMQELELERGAVRNLQEQLAARPELPEA
jgi:hypothetical protein